MKLPVIKPYHHHFNWLLLASIALSTLFSCSHAPPITAGKGAIYGTVKALPHREYRMKYSTKTVTDDEFYGQKTIKKAQGGGANKIDYSRLQDIFVCLKTHALPQKTWHLTIQNKRKQPEALALAVGDLIQIKNQGASTITPYIIPTDSNKETIQAFASIAPGLSGTLAIQLSGDLVLNTEENEQFSLPLRAEPDLLCKRLKSGGQYQFTDLAPQKNYALFVWHWRLGEINRVVSVKANQNTKLDIDISIDATL